MKMQYLPYREQTYYYYNGISEYAEINRNLRLSFYSMQYHTLVIMYLKRTSVYKRKI